MPSLLDDLRHLKDVSFHPGIDASIATKLEREHGIVLPGDHLAALQESNGVEAYAGYIRLFGLGTTHSIDAMVWNLPNCWKFAWANRCAGFWCFGETAWGDQYAYALESLRSGTAVEVYSLDALSMTPRVVASSFTEFLETEFVESAKDPFDAMTKQARQKLGPLELSSHLVYSPSLLLGGPEDINHVEKMPARAAMIVNGDIATQVDAGPADGAIKGVQTYEDELHRTRLRLVWK
jgi:hypothetical protein